MQRHSPLASSRTTLLGAALLGLTALSAGCAGRASQVDRWRAELQDLDVDALPDPGPGAYAPALGRPSSWGPSGARPRIVRVPGGSGASGGVSVFDVSDLLMPVRDFAGPHIGDLRRVEDRPDHGRGRAQEGRARIDPATLEGLVQDLLERGGWEPDEVTVTVEGGLLIVRHP